MNHRSARSIRSTDRAGKINITHTAVTSKMFHRTSGKIKENSRGGKLNIYNTPSCSTREAVTSKLDSHLAVSAKKTRRMCNYPALFYSKCRGGKRRDCVYKRSEIRKEIIRSSKGNLSPRRRRVLGK